MIAYPVLKTVHVGCAILSISGFLLRFGLMLRGSALLGACPARILPHVVDTLLLASAIAMALQLGAMPVWLEAKIAALFVYIALGTIAIKRGRTMAARRTAGIAAIACFGYIVSVALTKSAWGFVAVLGA